MPKPCWKTTGTPNEAACNEVMLAPGVSGMGGRGRRRGHLGRYTPRIAPDHLECHYAQTRHLSAKVRTFVDWVSALIQQDPIFQTR